MNPSTRKQDPRKRAFFALERGKECVTHGDLKGAKKWFRRSVGVMPTPDGYTFYAWMLSFDGEIDQAIQLCKKAIKLDNDFGNPYNDIGSYLIAKGKLNEAIGWFEKAKLAKRYGPRHFPHANLGRIYMYKGWLRKAKQEFYQALHWCPENEEIKQVLEALSRGLN